jgi:NAD(P)H-hydrate repair Nnr-like enzyme with NAD(P)H-hydrate dehydratase domain
VPVQAIIGLERDQRLAALAVVEQAQEAIGGSGDALAGVDGLCALAPPNGRNVAAARMSRRRGVPSGRP